MGLYDNSQQSKTYQEIMDGYAQRAQATNAGYGALTGQVMNGLNQYGHSLYNSAAGQYASQIGQADAGLAARGLGNTTIRNSVDTGIGQSYMQAKAGIGDTIARTKADYLSGLGQAQLGFQGQSSNQYAALGESGAGLAQQGALGYANLANQAQANQTQRELGYGQLQNQAQSNAWQHQLGLAQNQQASLQSDRNFLLGGMQASNSQQQTANQADQFQELYGYRKGGYIRGYAQGGPIPGMGNTDNQIIAATPGEYMLSKQMIDGLLTGKISHADLIKHLQQPQESPAPQPVPVAPQPMLGYACGGYIMKPRVR